MARAGQWVFVSLPVFKIAEHILTSRHYRKDEHIWYFTDEGIRRWFGSQGFDCAEQNTIESMLAVTASAAMHSGELAMHLEHLKRVATWLQADHNGPQRLLRRAQGRRLETIQARTDPAATWLRPTVGCDPPRASSCVIKVCVRSVCVPVLSGRQSASITSLLRLMGGRMRTGIYRASAGLAIKPKQLAKGLSEKHYQMMLGPNENECHLHGRGR